jgi:germination protein M
MRKWMAFIILCLLLLTLTACDNSNNQQEGETVVKIYYIDTITSQIVSEKYTPTETQKEDLVEEFLNALRQVPEDVIYKSALPENVNINDFTFSEDDRLTINFDATYNELTGINEVVCRAAIVKTLCQIAGVEFVEFNVNGQPLTDANGVLVGFKSDEDFIESIGDETNYKVSLYFTNENGDELIEYITNIYYNGTGSIEEMVINQLINGPTEIGMYHTIPEGTTLLDVSTKEGICYVDFNEKFLENVPTIEDQVVIYSVVNTLVELPNINKVQFYINGEVQKTYRENIDGFDGFFERNLDLIKSSK